MKRLYELSTEELFRLEYVCGCGKTHSFCAPVIVTENAVDEICKCLSSGHVLVITADDVDDTTPRALERELVRRGYRVDVLSVLPFSSVWNVNDIEDDVRMIIAYGGSSLVEFCKVIAMRLDVKLVAFPMGFDYDVVLSDEAGVKVEGKLVRVSAKRPDLVVIDYDGLTRAGEDVLASAYGRVLSKLVTAYDYYFSGRVLGSHFCADIMNAVLRAVTRVIKLEGDVRSSYGVRLLSDTALRLAIFGQIAGNPVGGEYQLAVTLERYLAVRTRDKRLFGENLFICAVAVSGLYRTFLKSAPFALTVPPSRCRSVVGMRRLLMLPDTYSLSFIRGYDAVRAVDEFKLRLFREELLDMAEKIYLLCVEGTSIMRRVYSDAGFFMKYYLGSDELLELTFVAPDYASAPTLLTYVKDTGALEKFERRTLAS